MTQEEALNEVERLCREYNLGVMFNCMLDFDKRKVTIDREGYLIANNDFIGIGLEWMVHADKDKPVPLFETNIYLHKGAADMPAFSSGFKEE